MATNDLQFAAVKHTNVRTDGLVTDEMTVDSQAAPGYWKNDKLVMTLKFSIPKFSFQCQELCSEIWMKTNYDLLHMSQLLFVLTKSPWSDAETLFSNSPLNRLDWRGSIAIYIRSNVVATNIDPIPFLMEKKFMGRSLGMRLNNVSQSHAGWRVCPRVTTQLYYKFSKEWPYRTKKVKA